MASLHSHEHVVIGLVREGVLTSRYGLQRYTVSGGQGRSTGWSA